MSANLRLRLADGDEIAASIEGALGGQLRDLLAVGYAGNKMRIAADESDDVVGHALATTVQIRLYDEDDTEGHALTLHLPNAQAARDLQKKLLAAGVAGVIVVGAATTAMVAPNIGSGDASRTVSVPVAAPAPATAPGLKADIATGDAAAPVLAPAPATAPGLKADIATGDAAASVLAPAPATAPGLKADIATGDAAVAVPAPDPAGPPGLKADLATGDAAAPATPEVSDESSYPALPGESRAR
jgi:hypothetical protein